MRGVELRAARRRLARDHVDDAPDRARAEQRRAAALGDLDPIDQAGRNLLEAVDLRQRGERRLPIHQDLRVRPLEAEQADLREVAVLAVVLDPHAGGVFDRVGQRSRADLLHEVAGHDLGAHGRVAQPGIAALGRHFDVGLERRREDDGGDGACRPPPGGITVAATKPASSTRTGRGGVTHAAPSSPATPITAEVALSTIVAPGRAAPLPSRTSTRIGHVFDGTGWAGERQRE